MSSAKLDFLKKHSEDGFYKLRVEPWQKAKQHFVKTYLQANFSRTDLRNKNKIFIDVGCGPGYLEDGQQDEVIIGSPLMALSLENDVHRYIFVDKDPLAMSALNVRIKKFFPKKNVLLLEGDINQVIETLPHYLPPKQDKQLNAPLALIDTYSFDVHFDTISWLSEMNVDLLLINAFPHSDIYTYDFYLDEQRELLNDFFGFPWARIGELNEIKNDTMFFTLAMKAYTQQLKTLGYNVATSLQKYSPAPGGSPYYKIAYCSKSRLFNSVSKEATKSSFQQTDLFRTS